MTPDMLEPASSLSRVEHSTTEPLHSLLIPMCMLHRSCKNIFSLSPLKNYPSNSMDPDQLASLEAGRSGSTLLAMQSYYVASYDMVDVRVTCIQMLKIASDGSLT